MQIRTPLNLIAGFMQVLRETYSLLSDEEKASFTDTMKQNAVTVLRMASMLFDVSWRGDQKVYDMSKDVKVNDVIDKCIDDFKAKSPHNVRLDYSNTLPDNKRIFSNALYLHRIIREILYNAKKFAPNSIVGLHVDSHDGYIRFVIEDNGPGIPIEEQKHVFEPFVKLDCFTEGLGLGLGLTRQHVNNLGGTITIDPEYTDGARIIIEIPDK
jgi:signal transduction histidine kinase